MTHKPVQDALTTLIANVAQLVRDRGYLKHKRGMRKISGSQCALVEFQSSTKSTREHLLFTINLGVVVGPLLEGGVEALKSASVLDAHLRRRLGSLLPDKGDKWWEITRQTDVDALAAEVSQLLLTFGIPYLDKYLDLETLKALWESGQGPGVTAGELTLNLNALKEIL